MRSEAITSKAGHEDDYDSNAPESAAITDNLTATMQGGNASSPDYVPPSYHSKSIVAGGAAVANSVEGRSPTAGGSPSHEGMLCRSRGDDEITLLKAREEPSNIDRSASDNELATTKRY